MDKVKCKWEEIKGGEVLPRGKCPSWAWKSTMKSRGPGEAGTDQYIKRYMEPRSFPPKNYSV